MATKQLILAYHADQTLKERLLVEMRLHQAQDNFIKTKYWDSKLHKGCAVGCTLQSLGWARKDDHEMYPNLIGIPIGLAYLQDCIFEGLNLPESIFWPVNFLEAIPVGADLSAVEIQLRIWLLTEAVEYDHEKYPEVKAAVDAVVDLLRRSLSGDEPSLKEWSSVATITHMAAHSAGAYGALKEEDRTKEVRVAAGAYMAIDIAVDAAAAVAVDVIADSAMWTKFAAKTLELLRAAPVYVRQDPA